MAQSRGECETPHAHASLSRATAMPRCIIKAELSRRRRIFRGQNCRRLSAQCRAPACRHINGLMSAMLRANRRSGGAALRRRGADARAHRGSFRNGGARTGAKRFGALEFSAAASRRVGKRALMRKYLPLREIWIWGRTPAHVASTAAARSRLFCPVLKFAWPISPADVARHSKLIITVTGSARADFVFRRYCTRHFDFGGRLGFTRQAGIASADSRSRRALARGLAGAVREARRIAARAVGARTGHARSENSANSIRRSMRAESWSRISPGWA